MRIVKDKISIQELKKIAEETFGNLVKAVVDVEREIMAIGGELHSDEEALLLEVTVAEKTGKNKKFSILKEISRLKEVLVDFFYFDNKFSSSDELLRKYFYAFSYAARLKKPTSS